MDDGTSDVNKKSWVTTAVASAHYIFRMYMGAVDQSDVKATVMGLTAEITPKWYKKQLAFCIETAVSSSHSNFNLDKSVDKAEYFIDFHDELLKELLNESKDYRKYKLKKLVRNRDSPIQRSHKKKRPMPKIRHREKILFGIASEQGLTCPGRQALAVYLRVCEGRGRCQFCGLRSRKIWKCTACDGKFCIEAPKDLIIPGSDPERKFRANGCSCWLRFHGYDTFSAIKKAYGQR